MIMQQMQIGPKTKTHIKKTDLHGNVVTHSYSWSHTSEATSSLLHACRQASNIVQSFPCMYARSGGLEQQSFNMQETSLRRMLLDNGNLTAQCHSKVTLQCPHIGWTAPVNITFMTMTAGTYKNTAHLRMLILICPKTEILNSTTTKLSSWPECRNSLQVDLNVLEHGQRNIRSF